MPAYIMLANLTPEGVQTVKNNPQRIREVEQLGAKVTAQWATLGRFDFLSIVDAPDEQSLSAILQRTSSTSCEVLVAGGVSPPRYLGLPGPPNSPP